MNLQREMDLESEYIRVLSYVETKDLVAPHGYTTSKIQGAITRYCRSANVEKPSNFCEMEEFVPDFIDWWLDENPEAHEGFSEGKIQKAVEAYLAGTVVWKRKVKNNDIASSHFQVMASSHLTLKNALVAATKAALSYNKRVPKTSQLNIVEAFKAAHQSVLQTTYAYQAGSFRPLSNKEIDEIGTLIGGYFAKDKTVLAAVNSIKMLEAPVMAEAA